MRQKIHEKHGKGISGSSKYQDIGEIKLTVSSTGLNESTLVIKSGAK